MRWGWSAVLVCAIGASLSQPGYANDSARSFPVSVEDVLNEWEFASRHLLGVGPMEHRRLYKAHHATHSAHEIAVLNDFRGPVTAADLKRRFDWSLQGRGRETVITGIPQDEVERLFFQKVAVTLDPETHLPKSVGFLGRDSKQSDEALAVVPGPRIAEPKRFQPAENARPLQLAQRNERHQRSKSSVRVVEHVTLMPVPKPEIPKKVQDLLMSWETSAQAIQAVDAKIERRVFERRQHVEHRASGEFAYRVPPIVHVTLKPADLAAIQTSKRTNAAGVPYELLPSPAEHWEYTPGGTTYFRHPGDSAFAIDPVGQNANRARLAATENCSPAPSPHRQIQPPWLMLFEASASQLSDRFAIRLNDDLQPAALEFVPKRAGDQGQFRLMQVQFDQETELPEVVRLHNQQGDREMVFTFRYTRIEKRETTRAEPKLQPVKGGDVKLKPAPTELHGQP